jgi:hypothetical protein
MSESAIEQCNKDIADIEEKIKLLNEKKKEKYIECNEKKYGTSKELDGKKLMDLIIYIYENNLDDYIKLINRFPDSKERAGGFITKSYIFEALWKIIFLLNFDSLVDKKYSRNYKISIERDVKDLKNDIDEYDYLNSNESISKINGGSISGICDFMFTTTKKDEIPVTKTNTSTPWACENTPFSPQPRDAYLFTSKYFGKPKGFGDNDYDGMLTEIREKYNKSQFKIVSLVKHGAELKTSILRAQNAGKTVVSYIDSGMIFDEGDLHLKYYPMLWKWLEYYFKPDGKSKIKYQINSEESWIILLNASKPILNISENLKFHQKYVVEYTNDLINKNKELEETEQNSGRYIWGCVARSGKSFMVGGLVARIKPTIVLLLLGAINETKSQFIDDLFQTYTDLMEYKVIDFQKSNEEKYIKGTKYVLVISQENLRTKVEEINKGLKKTQAYEELEEAAQEMQKPYPKDVINFISKCLQEKEKIIFFDEVHQGSGINSLQSPMIDWLISKSNDTNPLLIMTTATYAKPLVKYGKGSGNKDTILIEWDYQMIQKMKTFNIDNVIYDENDKENDVEPSYLIDKSDDFFKEKMAKLKEITDELNKKGKSCEDIAFEYHNSPELVYLLPTLQDKENQQIQVTDDITNESKTINIKQDLKQIFELKQLDNGKVFKYSSGVNDLLNYIHDNVYEELLHQKYDFVANGSGDFHSQLWFLPTSMRSTKTKTTTLNNKENKTIIGPLMRELGKAIVNHKDFKRFNVCVIHGKTKYDDYTPIISTDASGGTVFFKCINTTQGVKECIKEIERDSKKQNKSLIILTGQMLRLGISLNCTDVAIHMDDIHSYDIIYQSMFRVLTSRPNKKQGFFVDMLFDRAIKFFYEYTINQKKIKKGVPWETHKKDIIKNMLSYDVASIRQSSVGFVSVEQPINSYIDITRAFKLDSDEHYNKIKQNLLKNAGETDEDESEEVILNSEEEPEINNDDKKKLVEKKIIELLKKLKDDPHFIELIKDVKNDYKHKAIQGTKKKEDKFKENVDMPNNTLAALLKDNTLNPLGAEKPIDDETFEDKVKGVLTDIENVFTLILLISSQDNITIDTIFTQYDFTNIENITKIKECNNDDILYYCYILVTSDKANSLYDKVIISKKEKERRLKEQEKEEKVRLTLFKKEETLRQKEEKARLTLFKKEETLRKKEEKARLTEFKQQETLRKKEEKSKLTQFKQNGGLGDDEEELDAEVDANEELDAEEEVEAEEEVDGENVILEKGTIIEINNIKTNEFYANGKPKYTKEYTIKWDDPTKDIQKFNENEFKNQLENISFSYNFDLNALDNEMIRNIILKKLELIKFLIKNQTDKFEINNLFDNIKERMGKLKGQLNDEKNAFINNPDSSQFCPALYVKENNKVLDIIRQYLTPKKEEKKLFGEVFTPLELVCEMLSRLPPEIWKNPNLKWLDPANGIGNYPIVVYFKLMETLKNVEGYSNEKKRSKHIIEKMLYMNELNPINVGVAKKLFKMIDSDATPMIMKGDFLNNTDFIKNFGEINFDIIIGNPPFNPPKTETGSSGNAIWPNFVMKSFSLLSDKGYLCLVHPSGWKKPTEEIFKQDKFIKGDYTQQIRQGQVWQVLKENGVFSFIYTNDQKKKNIKEYLQHFPAVDYYIYQKGDDKKTLCDTKNVFLGEIVSSTDVKLDYTIKYLPNLITKQALEILHKVTSKEGDKPKFKTGFDPRGFKSKEKGNIKYIYQSNTKKEPVYQYFKEINDNVNISKVVINYGSGIDGFYCSYIDKDEKIGVLHMTMYLKIDTVKEGKKIESFFNSDIVKFIFLITQYSVPPNTKNEPLVANSITIPPEGTEDYYKFFGIEEHKKYIEDILTKYEIFKQPKPTKETKTVKETKPTKETKTVKEPKTPKAATKKKAPAPPKTTKKTKPKGGSKKTKKQRRVKLPQKTRRKY